MGMLRTVDLFLFHRVRVSRHYIPHVTLLIWAQKTFSIARIPRINGFAMISKIQKSNQLIIPFTRIQAIICVHGFWKDHWMDRHGMNLINTRTTN
jgi:hypothetical protein